MFSVTDVEDLPPQLADLVKDFHAIQKIDNAIEIMKKHLERIYANPDKVTPYHLGKCKELERIELTNMKLATTGMKVKQLKFVLYMQESFNRGERFVLIQEAKLNALAKKLTMKELEFVVSLLPMLSTSPIIKKRLHDKIKPMILFQARGVEVETYDNRCNEYWDEGQPCIVQILKVPIGPKETRYRVLIWVQVDGKFYEITYNHLMHSMMFFVYENEEGKENEKDPAPGTTKRLQFTAMDGVTLQRQQPSSYSHFCTFKTIEKCDKFKIVCDAIMEDLKDQQELRELARIARRRERKTRALKVGAGTDGSGGEPEAGQQELNNNSVKRVPRKKSAPVKELPTMEVLIGVLREIYGQQKKEMAELEQEKAKLGKVKGRGQSKSAPPSSQSQSPLAKAEAAGTSAMAKYEARRAEIIANIAAARRRDAETSGDGEQAHGSGSGSSNTEPIRKRKNNF